MSFFFATMNNFACFFFFSSRRRHTRSYGDWSSDVCSSDLGVTGSGKTEVFLAAAEHALAGGRDVVLLVPEIALTHQIVERVRARFGGAVAVLHSGLGLRERWTEWRRIR